MTQEQLVMAMALVIVVMNYFSARAKRDKIYCTFRRRNKQKITKWVSMKDTHVYFDGMEFDVIPRCISFMYYTGGLFGWLNPMFVATLDYDTSSVTPLDPDNLENNNVVTPAIRKLTNSSDRYSAYARAVRNEGGKKKGSISEFLPWVAIIGIVAIGYFVYSDHQNNLALFNQVQQMQATLRSLVK